MFKSEITGLESSQVLKSTLLMDDRFKKSIPFNKGEQVKES
ncbi:hypothetical protein [Neobacillus drentensis]